ncbi:MAG: hypothetical protein KME22_10175 [Hassallia sp. WJT32-NPBG1]|nr:hypothetical protein [Hassallia sp. WJT32-NPBG1]
MQFTHKGDRTVPKVPSDGVGIRYTRVGEAAVECDHLSFIDGLVTTSINYSILLICENM